ncbi:MAG: hypothetical protein MZU97_07640, partial [Bacillus subtilis]|nr:hypothetical protein [Bacillus subtilis]
MTEADTQECGSCLRRRGQSLLPAAGASPGRRRGGGTRRSRRLFRAVAAAEAVHARSHFELLEKVGSTGAGVLCPGYQVNLSN